jgi:hypothetical protein
MSERQIEKPDEPLPAYGPAMSALSEKRRALVVALYDENAPRHGDGLLIYAAQVAGYGTPTSSKKVLGIIAGRIVHDDRVQAAIAEYSRQVNRAITPEAIMALKNVIRDPKHKDHARAIAMVIDRADPLQSMHTVKVEDGRPERFVEASERVLARIEEIAARYHLPPPPKIIEGECATIESAGA